MVPPGYKQTEVGVIPEDWEVDPGRRSVAPVGALDLADTACRVVEVLRALMPPPPA